MSKIEKNNSLIYGKILNLTPIKYGIKDSVNGKIIFYAETLEETKKYARFLIKSSPIYRNYKIAENNFLKYTFSDI